MFRYSKCLLNDFKSFSAVRKCSKNAGNWDLLSAVSLERIPVITKDLTELEQKFSRVLRDIELEKSYKSDFELRMQEDQRKQKLIKEGKLELDVDKGPQQTAQDFLDACLEEKNKFALAPRRDEKEQHRKSSKRDLDKRLLLLLSEKLGKETVWCLPQGIRQKEETLRQTAERVLSEKVGETLKVKFFGNAPCGFYKYKYPKSLQKDSIGAKVFFFKAQLLGGTVSLKDKAVSDFQWATRTELECLPDDYRKSVEMFLIDE